MKILYLLSYFPPSTGAAAINTFKIVEFLLKYGHRVMILSPGNMGKNYNISYTRRVKSTPNFKWYSSSRLIKYPFNMILSHYENSLRFLIKLKSTFSPDIIISQYHAFHYASVAGSYLSKKLKIPHIIRSHDIFFTQENLTLPFRIFNSIFYPKIFNSISKCNNFYTVCSELKDYLAQFKKFRKVNFKVHHNGIDTKKFYPMKSQDELKEKFGCDQILIFSGSLIPGIGLHDFVPILPAILKEYKEIHLLFLGDGSLKKYITSFAKKKNINKRIHILGQKDHSEIPYYINNSDIGIGRITHKKIWKSSIPVKCLEYMACKKPFISTPISDDIIKNEDVGIILKRNFTRKDMIGKFLMLIEDKNLQKKLGVNGFRKIQKEYRWENIMESFNKDLTIFQLKM